MRRRQIPVRAAVFLRARGRCPTLRASLSVRPMRALLLLACLTSAAAAPASAQLDLRRYRPLTVGDVRMYSTEQSSTTTSGNCPAYESTGHLREDVLRDTTIGSTPFRVVQTTRTNAAGAPLGTSLYAARVLDAGGLEVILVRGGGGGALVLHDAPSPSGVQTVPATATIGGTTYAVAGTHGYGSTGTGSGGSVQSRTERYAADIGPLESRRLDSRSFPPVSCSQSRSQLVYAVVSGDTYGANPVAGEGAPAAAATLRAYPNPARAALTVDADGAVRVFDALGRLVAQGDAAPARPLRLDVSAWPAGVYVARTDAGQAVRLVVAR